eukprot:CAMPEP_0173408746 /NCGR_PEP_ID=MMETSP1356-20130122/70524_1 /TAXON_ID=77927 ORGANISM="Hemiselmis virescens, Strain PCC157" /NCGR_SAMPLE_ID=MMETSP1356 /ASSEMBLY_ACC=CAM_ASM_000847 /LENGTH=112 /DNA_ID=CAMNT_0014370101 /DNA_START=246 /DNA_END=584 /DNA_ORIENTATION=-
MMLLPSSGSNATEYPLPPQSTSSFVSSLDAMHTAPHALRRLKQASSDSTSTCSCSSPNVLVVPARPDDATPLRSIIDITSTDSPIAVRTLPSPSGTCTPRFRIAAATDVMEL